MAPMRAVLVGLLAALAVVTVGCGGDITSSDAVGAPGAMAAQLTPADATAYVAVDTDLDSAQWQQVKELADAFPARQQLVAAILDGLGEENLDWERDIDPALGPQTAVVFTAGSDDPVGLTKPDDRAKLDALLAKDDAKAVATELEDGWVAIAETQAQLDAYRTALERGALADADDFAAALDGLPEDTIMTAFVRGERLLGTLREAVGPTFPAVGPTPFRTLGVAVEATEDGLHMEGSVAGTEQVGEQYEPTFLDRAPDRVIAAMSFHGSEEVFEQLRETPQLGSFLPMIEEALGVKLAEVEALFRGEGILYVRPGLPLPEVTLALEAGDATAVATVDRLMASLARFTDATVTTTGDPHTMTVEGVKVSWSAADGVLVVSSGPSGIEDFRGEGAKLADDEAFTEAAEGAGLGDETAGFLYLDLRQVVPLLDGLASLTEEDLPAEVRANLAPLESLVVHATVDGERSRFEGFLALRDE